MRPLAKKEKPDPKEDPKVSSLVDQTKGHVLSELLPKLEEMEERLKKQITAEITDVKGMIEGIATGQHKVAQESPPSKPLNIVGPEGQTKTSPDLKTMMNDPEIANWVNNFKQMGEKFEGTMDSSKNPIYALGDIPKNMQTPEGMQQMGLMNMTPMGQLTQFIQMMKMLEGGSGMFGGGNQMMQEIMYRQYLNTMLHSNQQGMAATKFFMKMAAMGPDKIAEFEKLSNDLMNPIKEGIETAAAKAEAEKQSGSK